MDNSFISDITVCIKSFMRSKKTRDCFESWQKQYPGLKFIIVDDGPEDSVQDEFYNKIRKEGHMAIRSAFDIGLPAGRNLALNEVKTKYVLIIDNDHLATENTNLGEMHRILSSRGDVSIVGGRIWEDVKEGDKYPRYEGFLDIETAPSGQRILKYELLNMDKCYWAEIDEIKYTEVDITHNFLLIKRDVYPTLKWYEEIKICGDHADYALEIKAKKYKYVFAPNSVVHHNYSIDIEDENPEYDKYRGRAWYLNVLANKWGLHMAVNFWNQIHVYDKYNEHA